MKVLYTKSGYGIKVDDDLFPFLSRFRWYLGRNGYPASTIRMHKLIFSAPLVDHKNSDKLDNQLKNLRAATQTQNLQNKRKQTHKTSSRFKGVSWHTLSEAWRSTIVVNKRQKHLGFFKSQTKAAKAYDTAARKYFGEFARPNFP